LLASREIRSQNIHPEWLDQKRNKKSYRRNSEDSDNIKNREDFRHKCTTIDTRY